MSGLTDAQKRILEYIQTYIGMHGYPPTRREIAGAFGFESFAGADKHLEALERKGYITITAKAARGIKILKDAA